MRISLWWLVTTHLMKLLSLHPTEINGIEFELNSILVEKWKGKPYRLVSHETL